MEKKKYKTGEQLFNSAQAILDDLKALQLNLKDTTEKDIENIYKKVDLLQKNTALTIDTTIKSVNAVKSGRGKHGHHL